MGKTPMEVMETAEPVMDPVMAINTNISTDKKMALMDPKTVIKPISTSTDRIMLMLGLKTVMVKTVKTQVKL
jgi:hypothetical protein